jgi:hypothetical protein
MRCKSCLQIFSQPSPMTKETRMCSICRGVKKALKRPELCEKRVKILLNREFAKRNFKKLSCIPINKTHHFIQHLNNLDNMEIIINE